MSAQDSQALPEPNNPLELTAHSAGFVVALGLGSCGPQLSGSVMPRGIVNARANMTFKTHT